MGYGIIGASQDIQAEEYQRYHNLMKIFSDNVGLNYGSDIQPLTAGNQKTMYDYLEVNQNKTKYAVMFCHEAWQEELEIVSWKNLDDAEVLEMDEDTKQTVVTEGDVQRVKTVKKFKWFLPCRFENTDHGEKDMLAYYILYNMTLAPSNVYTSPDKSLKVDYQMLAIKNSLDNALLETKAK